MLNRLAKLLGLFFMCEMACVPLALASVVKSVRVTPTIQTSAYEANDQLGGLQTLTLAGGETDRVAKLSSLVIVDKDAEGAAMRVLFFSESPTIGSADGAALTITDAEMAAKFLGSVEVESGDWVVAAGAKVASMANIGLDLSSTALDTLLKKNGNLYAVVQMVGTPTYTAASDLVFIYSFED